MSAQGFALPRWRVSLQQYIVNQLIPKDSANVLDVGCGVGHGVVFVAALDKNVVGVDLSKRALQQAKSRAKQQNVQNLVDFIRCTVAHLPLRHQSFDDAFCILLIDAFQTLDQPLKEIANVLDWGGRLIIADLDPTAFFMMTIGKIVQFWDKRSGHPYTLHSPSAIEEALGKLAFTSLKKQRKHMGLSAPIFILEAKKALADCQPDAQQFFNSSVLSGS
jgi:ubiquinone/menaquinone biosynthesis C-methylase UbiE